MGPANRYSNFYSLGLATGKVKRGCLIAHGLLLPQDNRRYTYPRLPATHRPHIHVDKIRGRIATHAAGLQSQRGLMQSIQAIARQPYINGLALHVKAMLCDAGTLRMQFRIGGGER